jgi:hypothetical protein
MDQHDALRSHLRRLLSWQDAHADFDRTIEGIPPDLRGERLEGMPHSPWQLLEHMRFTQRDVLNFCRDPQYRAPTWPDDYWPATAEPPTPDAWEDTVAAFREDRAALESLATNPATDLFASVPTGNPDQTYLRELLLVADHNAYHLGQLVLVRRQLGVWAVS